ncbi:MAG: WYL domain-containing protein [Verrucomicrobia bacterium]|nr:WYL domain-containing protein [Cytophagales bacterium]
MSFNKLALIRYKTIDECLQNRGRKWTLEDLIEKIAEMLYEYEGITEVSKRTVQLDIQMMRSDKIGYNAPIVVTERKYYSYADKNYSITKRNIGSQDLEKLNEVVKVLNQFKGFHYFEDVGEMIGRLEDKIVRQKNESRIFIDFEKNELLKGLEWIDPLIKCIKNQQAIDITYQSFKAMQPTIITVFPYLLKEFRNRWFLLCQKDKTIGIYALDRMREVAANTKNVFLIPKDFEPEHFFDDVIGVTKTLGQKSQKIVLKVDKSSEPYILTKPLHSSQAILKQDESGMIFSIEVIPNFELEREILGFSESMEVLSPRFLRNRISKRLEKCYQIYKK